MSKFLRTLLILVVSGTAMISLPIAAQSMNANDYIQQVQDREAAQQALQRELLRVQMQQQQNAALPVLTNPPGPPPNPWAKPNPWANTHANPWAPAPTTPAPPPMNPALPPPENVVVPPGQVIQPSVPSNIFAPGGANTGAGVNPSGTTVPSTQGNIYR